MFPGADRRHLGLVDVGQDPDGGEVRDGVERHAGRDGHAGQRVLLQDDAGDGRRQSQSLWRPGRSSRCARFPSPECPRSRRRWRVASSSAQASEAASRARGGRKPPGVLERRAGTPARSRRDRGCRRTESGCPRRTDLPGAINVEPLDVTGELGVDGAGPDPRPRPRRRWSRSFRRSRAFRPSRSSRRFPGGARAGSCTTENAGRRRAGAVRRRLFGVLGHELHVHERRLARVVEMDLRFHRVVPVENLLLRHRPLRVRLRRDRRSLACGRRNGEEKRRSKDWDPASSLHD